MKKWFIIPLILILAAIFIVGMGYQKPEAFDKGKVYEIVREIYPDVKNITEVIPYPECGELCLNVTFVTENDEKIQLTIDLNKGKTLPPNQSENETCVGKHPWQCRQVFSQRRSYPGDWRISGRPFSGFHRRPGNRYAPGSDRKNV